jgi:hypothetical protein
LNANLKGVHKTRLRTIHAQMDGGKKVRIPGTLKQGPEVNVYCDGVPPVVTDGYATFDVVDIPGRVGISRHDGYDPITLPVAVMWEAFLSGNADAVEASIDLIEQMAGMGPGSGLGARVGAPPVIRVLVTDNYGNVVPLIPRRYQWRKGGTTGLYRISDIAWDDSDPTSGGPIRNSSGKRLRQKAVITLTEYTPTSIVARSATARNAAATTQSTKQAKAS